MLGVLANDEGSLTVTGHSQPGHGTVTVRPDGSFEYTPTPGWSGTDTFTYTVTDGTNPPVTRTVTVEVTPPVAPPAGRDDVVTARPGNPATLTPLDNDAPGDHLAWDPGTLVLLDPVTGEPGKVVTVDGVGTWEVLDDGTVRFTPVDGFDGRATVTYRVTNSAGQSVEATMEVRYDVLALTDEDGDCVNTALVNYLEGPGAVYPVDSDQTVAALGGAILVCTGQDVLAGRIATRVKATDPTMSDQQTDCVQEEVEVADPAALALLLGAFTYANGARVDLQQQFLTSVAKACGLSWGS